MSENRDFGFCPRCGALMQDGICRSCGYGQTIRSTANGTIVYQNPPGTPPKKSRKGLIIGLSITGGVILVIALVSAIIYFYSSVFGKIMESSRNYEEYHDGYYDDDYDDYYDDYDYYTPDADDPYYREITDAVDHELSYSVYWHNESLRPDDTEDMQSYNCTYPVLKGENAEVFDRINAQIRDLALVYQKTFAEYEGGANSIGYVTYMDEEKVSVVMLHSLYITEYAMPSIDALTFSLETGDTIEGSAMTELDLELAMRFRAQNKVQNGTVVYVNELSDEELLEILKDPEHAVFFYTPVGLEVGFNYETGWVTVTLKDNAL